LAAAALGQSGRSSSVVIAAFLAARSMKVGLREGLKGAIGVANGNGGREKHPASLIEALVESGSERDDADADVDSGEQPTDDHPTDEQPADEADRPGDVP